MPKRRILTLSMHSIDSVHTHGQCFVITISFISAKNHTTPFLKGHFLHETESPRRDHNTSSIIIGGKGGAGPSSLHTMLEGRTESMNARWM